MQARTNALLKSAPVPIGAAGHGTTVPILAAVLPVLNWKEQANCFWGSSLFYQLERSQHLVWSYILQVCVQNQHLPVHYFHLGYNVPSPSGPLCSDWMEQDLHKGFPTSENIKQW